jgi:hypothetical protein
VFPDEEVLAERALNSAFFPVSGGKGNFTLAFPHGWC